MDRAFVIVLAGTELLMVLLAAIVLLPVGLSMSWVSRVKVAMIVACFWIAGMAAFATVWTVYSEYTRHQADRQT